MKEKKYTVKSIFGPTIQGEGSLCGTVTAFLRFSGCNMWDGREQTKSDSACPYCDTDFLGGERMTAEEIAKCVGRLIPDGSLLTISGGEPLLQLDLLLAETLASRWRLAIETNGTKRIEKAMRGLVHVTCSPKVPREQIALDDCDDLKILFPPHNPEITPEKFSNYPARSKWLQPVNGYDSIDKKSVKSTISKLYELNSNKEEWQLSLQLHKVVGVD